MKNKKFLEKLMFLPMLIFGFSCQVLPKVFHLSWAEGPATFLWLLVFLDIVCRFRATEELALTGIVFVFGYCLKFAGALGLGWVDFFLFAAFGLAQYIVFCVSASYMRRWNRFLATFLFPVLWTLAYLLATLMRFPSLLRVDMMFTDMSILIQAEHLIGSLGLSFAILWMVSLLRYAAANRKVWCAVLGGMLFLALLLPGIAALFPNVSAAQSLRVAYTTGPYIGDFINYSSVSYEVNEASLVRSVQSAAAGRADILVFNEEAFELEDRDEERFLAQCSKLAREHSVAVLLGLDITDTDESENGKSQNKLVLFDCDGAILGTYRKSRLIPILEAGYAPGDGSIPSHRLNLHGKNVKISYLICYDSNFPAYIKKVEADTDILFLPSWDWGAVTELHSRLVSAMAVENHISILKPTYDGLSIAVDANGHIFHRSSTDETGYEQLQIVDMPIRPAGNAAEQLESHSPFTYAIIGTEILSVLICLLLLIGNAIEGSERTNRSQWFTVLVSTTIVGCFFDALSWILDGSSRLNSVLFVSTVISMVLTFAIVGAYIAYLSEYIKERKPISQIPVIINWVYVCTAAVLTVIASITGDLFTFTDGIYMDGPLYPAYVVANTGSMLIGVSIIVLYRKALNFYDSIIAYVYMAIPILSAVINLLVENWSFAYPAITLSILLIFVMLQSDKVEQLEHVGKIVSYHATHDELTGLNNRRAFQSRKEVLKGTAGNSGIVFGDLNGLKYANDHLGHEAGDQLLIQYAKMLSGIFRTNEIYRISGDEFICMLENVPENVFAHRLQALENLLNQDEEPLACVGAAFGSNQNIDTLIKDAEAKMYEEKTIFHERFPKTKR